MNRFIISKNRFLKTETVGYYHQDYTGFKQKDNPDFLNVLKNTFNVESGTNLKNAGKRVVGILKLDIPNIIEANNLPNSIIVCVPRAKALKSYADSQLFFKLAVGFAANKISGAIDGTDYIRRIVNTRTTHIRKQISIQNDGDMPYPGITVATCEIDSFRIKNQNIILIDDIYTKTVNVDEDCIQALLDNGAGKVIFYSVGYSRGI